MPPDHVGNNYTFAYSPDGRLHVGGTRGIFTFDGRAWQRFDMPNGQLVRQLLISDTNRLYVGGYDQFGYIEWDARNQPEFTDLSGLFQDELAGQAYADIWQIVVLGNHVYFRGVRHMFAVDISNNTGMFWQHDARFGDMYSSNGELFMQFRGEGIKKLQGREFVMVPGTQSLTEQVMGTLAVNTNERVILERPGRWLRLAAGELSPLNVPASLPASNEFSAWVTLDQHTLALGDNRGAIHIVDIARQSHQVFQIANDYINELIVLDAGGMLALTDQETVYIPWPSPWLKTSAESGLRGSIQRLVNYGDHWLTLGNAGVMQSTAAGGFVPRDWTNAEAWDWLEIAPDRALLAESYELKEITGDSARTISRNDFYPRLLKLSRFDPSIVYIGTELGIAAMQRVDGDWITLFVQENLIGRVRDIHETARGELLLSVTDHGLVRAQFAEDHRSLMTWSVLDQSAGLPGNNVSTSRLGTYNNTLIASVPDGFFIWNNGQFQATDLDGLAGMRQPDEIFSIEQLSDNTAWAYSDRRVLSRQPNSPWQEHVVQPMNPGRINSLGELADGSVYLGGIGSVLRLDTLQPSVASTPVSGVAMRHIILRSDDGQESTLPVDGRHFIIPDRTYSLAFEYAPDRLPSPLAMQYQTTLSGPLNFDNDWDPSTRLSYADLPPGNYRLQIRARSGNGASSEALVFTFYVQPQWYETSWAKLLWLLLALGLLIAAGAGFTRWRLARLHAERKRLQHLIQEQTAELATANRKLENMAHIDALTGIANRRQLDRYLPDAAERCIATQKPLGLILIDVDHFKQFNDHFGHQRGDELLRLLADQLIHCLRRSDDILARYGGEEFIAVLPGADADMVADVAERMRSSVEHSSLGITISAGMVSKQPDNVEQVHALIGEADKRLYKAKQLGRNQVVSQ